MAAKKSKTRVTNPAPRLLSGGNPQIGRGDGGLAAALVGDDDLAAFQRGSDLFALHGLQRGLAAASLDRLVDVALDVLVGEGVGVDGSEKANREAEMAHGFGTKFIEAGLPSSW